MVLGDLPRLIDLWNQSGCGSHHDLMRPQNWDSQQEICQRVQELDPDIIIIGDGFGTQPFVGDELIAALQQCKPGIRIVVAATRHEKFRVPVRSKPDAIMPTDGGAKELRQAIAALDL